MKENRFYKVAEALFQVQPAEARRTSLMFLYLLLGMSAFILGRTVRDTLFLSYYKVSNLPIMYIMVAVVVGAVAVLYSRFADRFRRDRMIFGIDLMLAVGMLVFYYLVYSQAKHDVTQFKPGAWVYPAFYIFVEVMGSLIVVTFWTFANDLFTSREAKRLFSIIGAGGVFANVVSGFFTGWLVKSAGMSTIDLILLTGAYLFCGALVIQLAGRGTQFTLKAPVPRKGATLVGDMRDVFSSKHLAYIALVVAVMSVAITFVDYTFKMTAKQMYSGDQLTVFFSWFVGSTGIFACLMQFFVTGRLIERFGIMVALLLLPLGMGSGLLYFIPTVAIAGASIAQASNYVFRYTVNDATMQLLYIPVPANRRGRAKAFIDGLFKQGSNGIAGVALYFLAQAKVTLGTMAFIPVILVFVWLFLLAKVKREYLVSLMDTLKKRSLDLATTGINASDEGTAKMLTAMLTDREAHPGHVIHAVDMIPYVTGHDWVPVLTGLLEHPDAGVRNKALESLGQFGWSIDIKLMMARMQDEDEQVRATAIVAYCLVLKERAVAGVKGYLKDGSPRIRAAAVSGMIKHCGLDGILEAADVLKRMIENPDEHERFWGASTMKQIAVSNFYHTLFRLLGDQSIEVQKEAIAAAGEMRSKELVPALVYKLGHKGTASAGAAALVKHGDGVLDTLSKVLANPGEKREVRLRIPRIMSEIGTRNALECLMKCLNEQDGHLRLRIVTALGKIRRAHPDIPIDDKAIIVQVKGDIRRAYQEAVVMRDLAFTDKGWNLLREALEIRFKRHLSIGLRLIESLYPHSQMNVIIANLASDTATVRANAIEAIDNMVSRAIGRQIIPLIESGNPAGNEAMIQEVGQIRTLGRDQWLEEFLRGADPWLTVCTLAEIKAHGPAALLPQAAGAVRSHDPIVRETALYSMLSSGVVLVDPSVLEDLAHDRVPMVAAFAREVLNRNPVPGTEVP